MEVPVLQGLLEDSIPLRLKTCITAVLNEDPAYAADEIVELGEEILNQMAAAGFARYLDANRQTDSVNDFLIQLFISSGHEYNAGPLFRWAANALKGSADLIDENLMTLFWNAGKLNHDAQQFAELRNRVMHGFFVLPPEVNKAEAASMGSFLLKMVQADFFNSDSSYHFFRDGGFTGNWNITEPGEWQLLISDTLFGKLCCQVVDESSEAYWIRQSADIKSGDSATCPASVKDFVSTQSKGAFALWTHPADQMAENLFNATGNWLAAQPDVLSICYRIAETGLSFTDSFVLRRLLSLLNKNEKSSPKGKKLTEQIELLRKGEKRKIVLLVKDVHHSMFSARHFIELRDFLYKNEIMVIGISHHYEYLTGFFNRQEIVPFESRLPDLNDQTEILRNYLRYKGPYSDRPEDAAEFARLQEIFKHLVSELTEQKEVFVRRFADAHGYSSESVHEIYAVLHPWVKSRREAFEEDIMDELYGIPSVVTEATPVYLALGRRDVRLEYQHKVLSL
jgi:hypothetical protein